jgi:hypothetical protein
VVSNLGYVSLQLHVSNLKGYAKFSLAQDS